MGYHKLFSATYTQERSSPLKMTLIIINKDRNGIFLKPGNRHIFEVLPRNVSGVKLSSGM
jgi:hypothetical protein